jgi:hypothetical protein
MIDSPAKTCWNWAGILLACCLLLIPTNILAQPVRVRFHEGVTHGFLVLYAPDGKLLATGDMLQVKRGSRFFSQLVFHFHDGSIYEDTTVFLERRTFKLLTDHLIEKGPSFKEQSETWIDVPKGTFKAWSIDEHGKKKEVSKKIKYPDDVMNGLVYLVVKNIVPTMKSTTVSMVVGTPEPRVVKLDITPQPEDTFYVADSKRTELHYKIHIDITGVAGVVAPLIGKQPPDENMWIAAGEVPTFLKEQGELYNGGPIWTIALAGPRWTESQQESEKSHE